MREHAKDRCSKRPKCGHDDATKTEPAMEMRVHTCPSEGKGASASQAGPPIRTPGESSAEQQQATHTQDAMVACHASGPVSPDQDRGEDEAAGYNPQAVESTPDHVDKRIATGHRKAHASRVAAAPRDRSKKEAKSSCLQTRSTTQPEERRAKTCIRGADHSSDMNGRKRMKTASGSTIPPGVPPPISQRLHEEWAATGGRESDRVGGLPP